ncbi:hypothetical protein FI667_g3130, partial [Globisporangium splendens]
MQQATQHVVAFSVARVGEAAHADSVVSTAFTLRVEHQRIGDHGWGHLLLEEVGDLRKVNFISGLLRNELGTFTISKLGAIQTDLRRPAFHKSAMERELAVVAFWVIFAASLGILVSKMSQACSPLPGLKNRRNLSKRICSSYPQPNQEEELQTFDQGEIARGDSSSIDIMSEFPEFNDELGWRDFFDSQIYRAANEARDDVAASQSESHEMDTQLVVLPTDKESVGTIVTPSNVPRDGVQCFCEFWQT